MSSINNINHQLRGNDVLENHVAMLSQEIERLEEVIQSKNK
jgi:uncharacterized small protein (DUF1192 family)